MLLFGPTVGSRKSVDLPADGNRYAQLLAFFLAGAEAVPWRGVTRTRVIAAIGGFPVDGYRGFAPESEWALELLLQGPALRVPRTLFFKQIHPRGTSTASTSRYLHLSREELYRAWRGHRSRMIDNVERTRPGVGIETDVVRLAAQAAMLRRHLYSLGPVLPPEEALESSRMLEQAHVLSGDIPEARRIAAMLHLVLSHHELGSGRRDGGESHARSAAALDPRSAEARAHLSDFRTPNRRPSRSLAASHRVRF